MILTNPEPPVTAEDIADAELTLGLKFPQSLRDLYLSSNGGSPEPYVFENREIDTIIAEFLPLKSESEGTAIRSYQRLVRDLGLLPRHFFPFAVDGGGDYFFVDCSTITGAVYFYRSDSYCADKLVDLEMDFGRFWASLKEENE
jgi:hypothetical protein